MLTTQLNYMVTDKLIEVNGVIQLEVLLRKSIVFSFFITCIISTCALNCCRYHFPFRRICSRSYSASFFFSINLWGSLPISFGRTCMSPMSHQEFICNAVQNKKIVIILKLNVISPALLEGKIGQPIEYSGSGQSYNAAQQGPGSLGTLQQAPMQHQVKIPKYSYDTYCQVFNVFNVIFWASRD